MNLLKNKNALIAHVLVALVLTAALLTGCRDDAEEMLELTEAGESGEASDAGAGDAAGFSDADGSGVDDGSIFVYICGAIKSPGVYELTAGSRLYELLGRAGGYTDEADASYLNQAKLLSDGEKVYVPRLGEAEAGEPGEAMEDTPGAPGDGALLDINTADISQLQTLPGIGASRAADIVSYREANGAFKSIEDIKKVNGIKDGLFSKLKDRIRV